MADKLKMDTDETTESQSTMASLKATQHAVEINIHTITSKIQE